MKPLIVRGMHGMGDCIHQRAILRQLLERYDQIWLESSWVSMYHDLPAVRVVSKSTSLRTQTRNARREAARFSLAPPTRGAPAIQVSYAPALVRQHGSPLAAMCATCGVDAGRADFRLPIPAEWRKKADALVAGVDRPIMIYRPLVERREWGGCRNRNPDASAYASLLASVRDRFHVISVADLMPKVEWITSQPSGADAEFHSGELEFETLAALFARAALVFCSPGFAVPLAQAVGTSVVCVFGGYECASSFAPGARHAPYLGIDPIAPCQCFSHTHPCRKAIDLPLALDRLRRFADEAAPSVAVRAVGAADQLVGNEAVSQPRRAGGADRSAEECAA